MYVWQQVRVPYMHQPPPCVLCAASNCSSKPRQKQTHTHTGYICTHTRVYVKWWLAKAAKETATLPTAARCCVYNVALSLSHPQENSHTQCASTYVTSKTRRNTKGDPQPSL